MRDQFPSIPDDTPSLMTDFIRKCLSRDEKARWSADQLLDHSFIKEDSSKIYMEGSAMVLFLVRKLYQLSSTLAWIQYQMSHYATTLRYVKWPVFYPESSYKIMFLLSSTFSPYNRSNLKMSFSDENYSIAAQICSAF